MSYYVDSTHYLRSTKGRPWYKTKKPRVPLEVLACLALKGELPISKVESFLKNHHDHHVISDAFKYLKSSGMIYCSSIGTPTSRGGRSKSFFKIEERGLELLISESPNPQSFWNVMLGYCYHNEISIERVRQLYKLYLDEYLKYSSDQWYTFELDAVDRAFKEWLDRINSCDKIPVQQVLLETLAVHPNLTLKEVAQKMKQFREDEIENALLGFTLLRYQPGEVDVSYVHGTKDFKEKWQLLTSKIIKIKQNMRGVNICQLSLFGVLFILMLIRYSETNKLRHGLYYNDKPFLDYCDVIAENYTHAIPLVFKKWRLLKRILKTFAAYNFDIVLDQQFRENIMGKLTTFKRPGEDELHVTSGNKYLFESLKSILEISRRQLGEVQMKGIMTSRNFVMSKTRDFPNKTIEDSRKLVEDKVDAVLKLIDEITVNLETLGYDPISFKKQGMVWGSTPEEAERLSRFFEIDSIEGPIADKISFLYYLNLNDEWYFHVMEPSTEEPLFEKDSKFLMRPILCLSAILKEDMEIQEWFSKWVLDLVKYQEEVLKTMNEFYKIVRTPSLQV